MGYTVESYLLDLRAARAAMTARKSMSEPFWLGSGEHARREGQGSKTSLGHVLSDMSGSGLRVPGRAALDTPFWPCPRDTGCHGSACRLKNFRRNDRRFRVGKR